MSPSSVVILQSQMRDQFLPAHIAQRILQLHKLDEQVMLGIQVGGAHRALEVKRQPLLNSFARHFRAALGKIKKEHQVENEGCGQDRIATQKVDLDLHGISQPPENVEIIP